jgi:FAD/FMN-containing dehydrogenase
MSTFAPSIPPVPADLSPDRVVLPGQSAWDAARGAFNLLVDQQPVMVVRAADERDVAATVRHAREHGLRVAPRSTGHNAGPLGSLDGTILLDVAGLDEVAIDADARRVRVGAGVRWRQVIPALSELGLAALHGSSPDVGIAGYSLGGGMGWLARKHGLQTNSVTAFELVTADGHLVRADAVHEPDLFWALRGGGGNFGVVTAIEFAVLPVRELYAGALFFAVDQTADVLHAWTELLPTLPEELMSWVSVIHFPPAPEIPEAFRGRPFAIAMAAFLGSEADGRELLRPLRALRPGIDTFAMQPPVALSELAMDPTDPLPFHSTHALVDALPATAIEDVAQLARPGSTLALIQLRHMGGALARREPGAGARATLPGEICVFGIGIPPDASAEPAVVAELNALSDAVAPYRAGDYPNFIERPADASTFFDGETWKRLRQVKALYDPQDLFAGNHHVPPAPRQASAA